MISFNFFLQQYWRAMITLETENRFYWRCNIFINSSLKYFPSPFDTIERMSGGISLHGVACFFVFIFASVFLWLHILYLPPRRWRRMRRKLRSEQLPFLGWLVRDPLLVLLYYSMSSVAWSQIHLLSLISDWDLSPTPSQSHFLS